MKEILFTANELINHIEGLSYFIYQAKISEVAPGKVYIQVEVPTWYKWFFCKKLKKDIRESISPRLPIGLEFTISIYSEFLF